MLTNLRYGRQLLNYGQPHVLLQVHKSFHQLCARSASKLSVETTIHKRMSVSPKSGNNGSEKHSSGMIKLKPLSLLVQGKKSSTKCGQINNITESDGCDSEGNAQGTKSSVLSSEILCKVTQTVKKQVKSGEYVCDDSSVTNEEIAASDCNFDCMSIDPDVFQNPHHQTHEEADGEKESVYDVSVLFSDKLDIAYKRSIRKFSKQANKRKKDTVIDGSTEGEDGGTAKKKPKKLMPNYFIAMQITSPKIAEGLCAVQKHIETQKRALSAAMIPLQTLHITVLVMHLANQDEIERAKSVLDICGEKLTKFQEKPPIIDVSGIGHFGNNVIFAKIAQNDSLGSLHDIADVVEKTFKGSETNLAGEKGFKPHITIVKLSRAPKLRKKGIKKIDSKYYSEYINTHFGCQTIEGLQLCSMLDRKEKNGYYKVIHNVPFGNPTSNVFVVEMEKELKWDFTQGCESTTTKSVSEKAEIDQTEDLKSNSRDVAETNR